MGEAAGHLTDGETEAGLSQRLSGGMDLRIVRRQSGVLSRLTALDFCRTLSPNPSCEVGQAGDPGKGEERGPDGWVTQKEVGCSPTPSTGPFSQGLCLWNVVGARLGPNKIVHFSPKREKKDKFLHQALTATDKKNYRNQCLLSPLPVPAQPLLGCRAWSTSPSANLCLRPLRAFWSTSSQGRGPQYRAWRWGCLPEGWHRQKSQLNDFPCKPLVGNV